MVLERRGYRIVELVPLTIFPLLLVIEHTQVGGIARLAYATLLDGLAHSAMGLMSVSAVAIATIGRDGKNL